MNYPALSTYRAGFASDATCLPAVNAVVPTGITQMPVFGINDVMKFSNPPTMQVI